MSFASLRKNFQLKVLPTPHFPVKHITSGTLEAKTVDKKLAAAAQAASFPFWS
jgi:hypothetical protein